LKSSDKEYFRNWEINSSLIGPTDRKEILPIAEHGTLVKKYQKCGKKCRTCGEGKGHGPYLWRVTYDKETKKQVWKYVRKIG
jgi:hypothetical protein